MKNHFTMRLLAFVGSGLLCGSALFAGCSGGLSSNSVLPLVGTWGAMNTDAVLQLSASGGQLRVLSACGWGGPLNAPIIPDASNHFSVSGTYTSNLPPQAVQYEGVINGDTITLTVTDSNHQTRATYTLVKNHVPTPFDGPCPG
jgi:hypothetical protein